jgi:hypothetical protein
MGGKVWGALGREAISTDGAIVVGAASERAAEVGVAAVPPTGGTVLGFAAQPAARAKVAAKRAVATWRGEIAKDRVMMGSYKFKI